jgi:excisionase family DNA binding protein
MSNAPTTLLTIREAANQLRLCHDTIRRAIWKGDIIAHRFAGSIRISQEDLDDYVRKGRGVRIRPHRKKATMQTPS